MMLNDVTQLGGARKRRKRLGRGESSGHGKTSGRGNKGCNARAGGGVRPLTEGGQMPLFRRLPKRGFNNFEFARNVEIVNLADLDKRFADGETVSLDALRKHRLVTPRAERVKILAKGAITKKLAVEAHAFSGKAQQAVEAAGGSVKRIELLDPAAAAKAKRRTRKNAAKAERVSRIEKKKGKRATAES